MKMMKPRMSKGVAVAALMSVCVAAWGFGVFGAVRQYIAAQKTATADSYATGNTPNKAVDSIYGGGGVGQGSRWENNWGAENPDVSTVRGNAWLCVDLGATYTVDSVAIYWEHSGSSDYKVQAWAGTGAPPALAPTAAAVDSNWTTLIRDTILTYSTTADMCLSFLKLPATAARYVRMHSYKRLWNPGWGVSIIEFMIFGTPGTSAKPAAQYLMPFSGLSLTKTNSGVSISANGLNEKAAADIFAPNGKMVRHLSGSDASFWNLKDAFGNTVTNGTYMVRVSVAGKTYQDKVLISR
jgi:hypothetical protein